MKKSIKNTKAVKEPTTKKIVVKCADFWMDEHSVDSELFDDVYVEAATRAILQRRNDPNLKVTIVLECWEKKDLRKPERHFCYNTYLVFINAGMYQKAEILRSNFMRAHGIDLSTEHLKGDNDESFD